MNKPPSRREPNEHPKLGCVLTIALRASYPAAALDITPDAPPPEQPEATYNEIIKCLSEKGAFNATPATRQAAQEDCEARAAGITLKEYIAMGLGCVMTHDDAPSALCGAGIDKLRPMFAPGAMDAATAPPNLKAVELLAMESGCAQIRDDLTKTQCLAGIGKLKEQILRRGQ